MILPASPRARAALRRAAPFAVLVAAIAAFDLACHEFWRDEAGALLIAREVPWRSLLGEMRYEGVPPLFHALLKIAALVLPSPLALVLTGALGSAVLLYGTYRLLETLSGAPRASAWVTFAFALTYAYAYELGVMVRQYGLGLGLALLAFAHLRQGLRATASRRHVWIGTTAAALAAITSAHAACLAGGALLAFGLLSVARARPLARVWPIVLTLPCFALDLYLAAPFPGRIAIGNVVVHHRLDMNLRLALQALVTGVMPTDWWGVESLVPPRAADAFAMLRSLAFWSLLAGAALALAARLRALKLRWHVGAFELMAVVASWPPLLEIILHHYWGFYRHHLFLGTPLLVVLAGWGLARLRTSLAAEEEARFAGLALLAPWFLLQIALAVGSFVADAQHPFSDTKAAARLIPPAAHVVAESEWRTLALLLWRPDIQMRSPAWRGRPYRYARADRDWRSTASVPALLAEECRAAPTNVTYAGAKGGLGPYASCGRPIPFPHMDLGEHPFTWESFDLFAIDCACVGHR